MGRAKSITWHDYHLAFEIIWGNGIVSLDTPLSHVAQKADDYDKDVGHETFTDELTSSDDSPESLLIKKESVRKLSNEAKEVIRLIVNAPQEVFDCFYADKYDKISKDKIRKFLYKEKRWNTTKIKRCFKELKNFCADFH